MAARWYVFHVYSGFEKKVSPVDPRAGQAERPRGRDRAGHGPGRGGHRGAPRQQGAERAQVLPGLRAAQDGDRRRDLASRREYAEGYRLPRRQGPADPVGQSEAAASSGRMQEGVEAADPRSPSRSASRCGCATGVPPPSTGSIERWTRSAPGSRFRSRSSGAPRRVDSSTRRSKGVRRYGWCQVSQSIDVTPSPPPLRGVGRPLRSGRWVGGTRYEGLELGSAKEDRTALSSCRCQQERQIPRRRSAPPWANAGLNIIEFCKSFNAATQKMEPEIPLP